MGRPQWTGQTPAMSTRVALESRHEFRIKRLGGARRRVQEQGNNSSQRQARRNSEQRQTGDMGSADREPQ